MIVDKIEAYLSQKNISIDESLRYEIEKLAGIAFKRQFMTEEREVAFGQIRLSAAGACPTRNAYAYHGFEKRGKETDSRAKMIFWLGDLAEMTVVSLAKLAGCAITATGFNQIKVSLLIGNTTVPGHPDGLFIESGIRLLEVKSMTSYRFEEFQKEIISNEYLDQINSYLEALDLNSCIIIALNKESGVLHENLVTRDHKRISNLKSRLKSVIDSTPSDLPEKPFKPDVNGVLPWNCLYCSYWGHCWPDAERKLVKKAYKLVVPIKETV